MANGLTTAFFAILERQRDFGVFKALGMTWRQIVNSVLIEAGLLEMIASAVGIPLGLVLTRAFFDFIGEQSGIGLGLLDVIPGIPSLVTLFSMAVLVAALGATVPVVRAARYAVKISGILSTRASA